MQYALIFYDLQLILAQMPCHPPHQRHVIYGLLEALALVQAVLKALEKSGVLSGAAVLFGVVKP
jgi:hypothetical protein